MYSHSTSTISASNAERGEAHRGVSTGAIEHDLLIASNVQRALNGALRVQLCFVGHLGTTDAQGSRWSASHSGAIALQEATAALEAAGSRRSSKRPEDFERPVPRFSRHVETHAVPIMIA